MDDKEQKHIKKLAKKFTQLKTLKEKVKFVEDNPLIPVKKNLILYGFYMFLDY